MHVSAGFTQKSWLTPEFKVRIFLHFLPKFQVSNELQTANGKHFARALYSRKHGMSVILASHQDVKGQSLMYFLLRTTSKEQPATKSREQNVA